MLQHETYNSAVMATNSQIPQKITKRFMIGAFVSLVVFSLFVNKYLVANFGIQFSEKRAVSTTDATVTYAIFYNAFINPALIDHSLGIITEQLAQWQNSRYANMTLYYTHLGDTSVAFPCSNNTNCKLLTQKPAGWEDETLSKLQEYCQQHPDHNVIYLHSKGTFTAEPINDRLRNLLTPTALSNECFEGLSSAQCNVCSARFSPVPHWHTPGNMWTAKCTYIGKLYPIQLFEAKVVEVVEQYHVDFPDTPRYPDSHIGTGRYANEHWVHTHPEVQPCDVFPDTTYVYNYWLPDHVGPPYSLAKAPRIFPNLKTFDILQSPAAQIKLTYRLYELQKLYNATPSNESFVWSWYEQVNLL